jgi:ubiquinone/menaquinone biosynthesis C-methylase UbiE
VAKTTDLAARPEARERYIIPHDDAHVRAFRRRTLAMCAPFLLPHLRPGLTVLDCGCGPGSMTIELAELVAPGLAVGIDLQANQLEQARAWAAERGIGNVRFEEGDVYALPFADAAFHLVYSHALVSHLREPARAFAEMRRVLKPGGLVAVAENDVDAFAISPAGSVMVRYRELFRRVQEHNGGLRLPPRRLRAALLAAGFMRAEGYASAEAYGTPDETRLLAAAFAESARAPHFVRTALGQGWAGQAELDELPAALLAWGERPDAFLAALKCGALGWVDGD